MMKKYRACYHLSILAAGLLPLLAGCVTDQDFRGLELQLRSMDNRMVALENEVQELQRGAGTSVEVMKKQQAGLSSNLDRLNTEFLQVKGQLDESRHRYRNLQEENQSLQEALKGIQQQTEQKNVELQERIGSVESSTSEIDSRLSTVHSNLVDIKESQALAAARAAEQARKKADAASRSTQPHEITPEKTKKTAAEAKQQPRREYSSPEPTPRQSSGTGQKMYDQALDLFKAKKYKEAQELFSEFIKKNPNDDLAVNARFWVGDCLFNQNEFALAILEYQNVIADFPNHIKAPAALFKQGMAFEKLQDADTAKIVYKKIIAEYPKSDQVEASKKRLEELSK
jgi:tol-pal system protein YbgF